MGENLDKTKGRAKEAAGDLTNNDDLKREGKRDRAGAAVKGKATDAANAIGRGVDSVKDKLKPKD